MVKRYPLNAPGGFYTEDGMCVACMLPEDAAPDLIGGDLQGGGYHCHFKKQPCTPDELQRAFDAIEASCVGCLHYDGSDPEISALMRMRYLGDYIQKPDPD